MTVMMMMMMMMMMIITHSSSFIRNKRSKKDYLCKIMAILKTVKSAGIDHGTGYCSMNYTRLKNS